MSATEYVILVDAEDREIGMAEKLSAHEQNLLHRAFSVFIFRDQPRLELLLQQRALHKYHSPGLWTNTCCSHPRANEPIIAAGKRRLREEMGVLAELTDIGWFHYNAHFANGLSENEIDHVLIGLAEPGVVVKPNHDEVYQYRWVGIDAIQQELAATPDQFTPWFGEALGLALEKV